ncbi:hypothetical protein [Acidicapsa ligni]|uniref:hypothetical protein n=1 Tax=Acidicapsa ligni TaxID=542300 RepID=UPI0021DFBC11|nr:hypothetical protein [Acidicapsa ligni]
METQIRIPRSRKNFAARLFRLAYPSGIALLAAGLLAVSGCSSGSSSAKPQVGVIAFTDVNGTPLTTPPTALTAGQGAYLDVNVTNDPHLLGANWGVYCGSQLPPGTPLPPGQIQDPSCGTFTPAHTMSGPIPSYVTSGAGYISLYNAPVNPPKQGVVTLYAYATSDHSVFSTVTLTINAIPISIQFAPPPPTTLEAGTGAQFKAVLSNDTANAGATWSAICSASDCGSFSPAKTASGGATTYTAPIGVPTGGTVKVVATSVTDPTKAVSAVIQIEPNSMSADTIVAGRLQAARQPVSDAQVTLYAAVTNETAQNGVANSGNAAPVAEAVTDQFGNFSIPNTYECPTPDTQMYLMTDGGNAGGGTNPDLALMAALGSCSTLATSHFVVNEATTVAAVYALSGFMSDPQHVGSAGASPTGIAAAFSTARDLVDATTGLIRVRTVSGEGIVPQAKIGSLANLLSACAQTAGSSQGDGSVCDQLFRATNFSTNSAMSSGVNASTTQATQAKNTVQALLDLARNAIGSASQPDSFTALYQLASLSDFFAPSLSTEPRDWTLAIQFPTGQKSTSVTALEAQSTNSTAANNTGPNTESNAEPSTDSAGNIWVHGSGNAMTEFVGGASCTGMPKALIAIAASSRSNP